MKYPTVSEQSVLKCSAYFFFYSEQNALQVDGGMTKNVFFNQTQSDIIGRDVIVSRLLETTALGAAMVAAIGSNLATSVHLYLGFQLIKTK